MKRISLAAAVTFTALADPVKADFLDDSQATLNLRNMYYSRNLPHTDNSKGEAGSGGRLSG